MASSILRSTSICAFISAGLSGRVGNEVTGDRPQAVQPRDAADQMRDSTPEAGLDLVETMLVIGRNREEQGRQTAVGIQLEAAENERHPERMRPDAFAAAWVCSTIDFTCKGLGVAERPLPHRH